MTIVYLGVPSNVNLSQFTNVQRGTIFMWFLALLICFIVTVIRLITGNLDPEGANYEEGKDKKGQGEESTQSFDKQVIKAQIVNAQDDSGSVKLMKKVTRFSTIFLPLTILFALSFLMGSTYAFSLVLYFLVILPLILFNVMEFHKWACEHKAFICLAENLWIIGSFFWLVNIWVTGNYWQPYYLTQVS